MADLTGKRAAILVADKFQDEEVAEPAEFLRARGVEVVYVGIDRGLAHGKNGRQEVEVELAVSEAPADSFDALVIPGGAAPETLRLDEGILAFTRHFFEATKPVAAICHGPQVLISAGVLPGRTMTCFAGIRDDVRLAGARYRDKPVVVDGHLATSRTPADIPVFNEALAGLMVGGAAPAEDGD